MTSVDKIIEKISKHASMSKEEVKKLIEEKQDELSGLISEEGAAYIVGRELGINLLKESKRQLKIKNLVSGLRSVDIAAKIVSISEPREFEKNGKKGRVVNVLMGDATGAVRLSLWNDETEMIGKMGLKEDSTIRITGGYVKEDNRGNPEVRLGRGKMQQVEEDIEIPNIQEFKQDFSVPKTAKRKSIKDFNVGGYAEARACLVQIFRRNPFFYTCSTCRSRVTEKDNNWVCPEHGNVEPEYNLVLSGVIDDGSGNIRVVFFRELAEKIFGKSVKELREIAEKEKEALNIYDHFTGLGKDYIIRGNVRENRFTENTELIANEIDEMDVKKECEDLLEKSN